MTYSDIRLSYYKTVEDKFGIEKSLDQIIDEIKSKHKDPIQEIRNQKTKVDRNKLKKRLPCFTCSGTFNTRKISGLKKHSGLIQIDIDDIKDPESLKEIIKQDMYTLICFTSPSGNGLKVLVSIDVESNTHLENFKSLERYYKEKYDITIDPSTKDVSRLCFVSWDEKTFVNKDSQIYRGSYTPVNDNIPKYTECIPKVNAKKQRKRLNTPEIQQFESILNKIEQHQIDITGVYDDWLKIGFAINSEFGENGRAYYHRLSSIHADYSSNECNTQYNNCVNSTKEGITMASFYYYALKAISQAEKEETKSKTIFHITEEELAKSYDLRFNTLKVEIEIREKDSETWEECNESQLYVQLNKKGIAISESKLHALLRTDFVTRYDPIFHYFENIKPWKKDDKDYIKELISYVKTDNPEEIQYNFKKWIVRCVKCALEPEYFNKQAFILVHDAQNSGKSTFCRNLCPESLSAFLRDDLPDNKDAKIALASNFIINLDELANLNKKDVDQLKTYFSTSTVKERLPYDRKPTTLPRRANFIGSTNNSEFLVDSTGSVRWLCFEINKINWNYKKIIDIDNVWSQAYWLSRDVNFNCEFSEEDIIENEKRNAKFQLPTSEEDLLIKYFDVENEAEKIDANFYSATRIVNFIHEITTRVYLKPIIMGKVLAKYKFKKHQNSKGVGRGYYIKQKEVV